VEKMQQNLDRRIDKWKDAGASPTDYGNQTYNNQGLTTESTGLINDIFDQLVSMLPLPFFHLHNLPYCVRWNDSMAVLSS